ncbi:hypothetical protein, partial [Lampropedia puyangensis]|uniref:hypothetical protein n=1 Tax=Lampropedia puyangensis TaxID=1330072 RepID=UPI001B86EEF4
IQPPRIPVRFKGGITVLFVAKHLHDQCIALHINSQASTWFAVYFFADDPSTSLGCEIPCCSIPKAS